MILDNDIEAPPSSQPSQTNGRQLSQTKDVTAKKEEIDREVERRRKGKGKMVEETEFLDNDTDDCTSSDDYNSSEERMAIISCDEDDVQYIEFNEATGMEDPKFSLGMLFTSGEIFRAAVRKHAIVHQRPILLKKKVGKKNKMNLC